MTNLTTDILSKIEIQLSSEKNKIETTLLSLKSQDPYSDPDRLNDNAASDTEANEESSHERMEALEKELLLHLEEINQALSRLNKGNYGMCFLCKKPINADRLAIKPTAIYCVSCEQKKKKS